MQLAERGFVAAVNHLLRDAAWALERLRPFAGKAFRIDATPVVLNARLDADGRLALAEEEEPEVTLMLPFAEAPLLLEGMNRLMGRVRIAGNAEFAEALGFVFRNLSWDVEEDLSRVVGDVPARRIVSGMQGLKTAQQRGLEALSGNLGEYLTEESGLMASVFDVSSFTQEVATLRDDVARTGKKLERLERMAEARRVPEKL